MQTGLSMMMLIAPQRRLDDCPTIISGQTRCGLGICSTCPSKQATCTRSTVHAICAVLVQVLSGGSLLAAADDYGLLVIVDTSKELPSSLHRDAPGPKPVAAWESHNNAIFDLAWAQV